MKEFVKSLLNWEIISAHPDKQKSYDASSMERMIVSEDEHCLTALWQGHPELGKDFSIRVCWKQIDKEIFSGSFEFSAYQADFPVEIIHFPIFTTALQTDSAFLAADFDIGAIHYGEERLGAGAVCEKKYISMQFSALLNKNLPSIYFDHRDRDNNAKGYITRISEDGLDFTYTGVHYLPMIKGLQNYKIPYLNSCGRFRGAGLKQVKYIKNGQ